MLAGDKHRQRASDGRPRPSDVARLPTPVSQSDAQRRGTEAARSTGQHRGCTAAQRGGLQKTAVHSPTSVAAAENRHERQRLASQNHGADQPDSTISQRPSLPRTRASLDKELEDRLKELQLDKDDASSNSRTVEELGEIILSKLKQSYSHSFHWDKLNSGSYYDKTKVRHC